ncbi:MAG: glutamate synthase small subunit, partial [Proteobacteria bacterium]
MKKDTNKFLKQSRVDASKIDLVQRKNEFIEIYQTFDNQRATEQSERCLECGNPYCQWKCPVHNYIPVWLKMVLENRIDEAVELSHQTNSFPEICGRVCPQDRLCEGSCTLDDGFGAVTIGNVEKYITDNAFAKGWRYSYPELKADAPQVAIIGAGPAGLACADVLLRSGVKPVIF